MIKFQGSDENSYIPLASTTIFGMTISIIKKPEFSIEILETEPYARDGEVPMIFVQLAWVDITFENKWLYKKLYFNKHGWMPPGLQDNK
jgi:hypothetical protein